MTYRKTWFDYVLWAVYAGLCVMLLAYVGNRMYAFYVGAALTGLGTFLLFPVFILLYTGLRLLGQTMRKKYSFSVHFSTMTEALAVSVSFVFGTILRIREGLLMAFVYDQGSAIEAGSYYELALVRTGEERGPLIRGMSDLYVRCLRGVFSFLGNSVEAAVLFQVFLQTAAMVFAFLAVRKAAGRLSACIVLLLLAFSGSLIQKVSIIDPECLLTALFLAGLFLVISFVKARLAGRKVCGGLPGSFLLGAALGLLCYLEGGCVLLFLFLAGIFTGKRMTETGKKQQAGNLLIVIAGGCAGFFGAMAESAAESGVIFYRGLTEWAEPYLHPELFARMFGVIGSDYLYFAFIFLAASFVVFSFIRSGREQEFSLWLLPCILVTPVFLIDLSGAGFGSLACFFWSVMAGLGLKSVIFGGQAELVKKKTEEIHAASSAGPVLTEPVAAAQEEKPRFIENPLPLPKKHVKKEMDYGYTVPEADMHYDVEIAEEDDFDQ